MMTITLRPPANPDVELGDVIQCSGNGVPDGLEKAYFQVVNFDKDGTAVLSRPWKNAKCTIPFFNAQTARRAAMRK